MHARPTVRKMARVAMVALEIALLLILPRDAWPVALYAYLSLSALAASHAAQLLVNVAPGAFLLSCALAAISFSGGGLLLDLWQQGGAVIYRYDMWALSLAIYVSLYCLAATLVVFPLVGLARGHALA